VVMIPHQRIRQNAHPAEILAQTHNPAELLLLRRTQAEMPVHHPRNAVITGPAAMQLDPWRSHNAHPSSSPRQCQANKGLSLIYLI
jgi:hypothetical protein